MKTFKVSNTHKLCKAAALLGVLSAFIIAYYVVEKNAAELPYQALTWGIPILLIYYTFYQRMKIEITDDDLLVCKTESGLFATTIDIQQIQKMEVKKGRLYLHVVLHYNGNKKIKLYPEDCALQVGFLQKESV